MISISSVWGTLARSSGDGAQRSKRVEVMDAYISLVPYMVEGAAIGPGLMLVLFMPPHSQLISRSV